LNPPAADWARPSAAIKTNSITIMTRSFCTFSYQALESCRMIPPFTVSWREAGEVLCWRPAFARLRLGKRLTNLARLRLFKEHTVCKVYSVTEKTPEETSSPALLLALILMGEATRPDVCVPSRRFGLRSGIMSVRGSLCSTKPGRRSSPITSIDA
jgi:hypothetical protein